MLRYGPSGPACDPAPLGSAVERIVGRRTMGSLSAATMLFAYDVETARPRGREIVAPLVPRARANGRAARLLRRVCAERPCIDGGFAANNPSACALAEGRRLRGRRALARARRASRPADAHLHARREGKVLEAALAARPHTSAGRSGCVREASAALPPRPLLEGAGTPPAPD
jgi:hypothetical protein